MGNKIELVFLGTGSAVPTAKRNHPATLLKYKNETLLFDCGEGVQRQFRKARENPCKLTRIFLTHWHGDHVLGLPGLLQTLKLSAYSKTLHIYGPKGTKKFFNAILKMFVFVGNLDMVIHEVVKTGKILDEKDFYVETQRMDHGTPAIAYRFVEKDKLRIDKAKFKKLKLPHTSKIQKLTEGKDVVIEGKKIKFKSITYLQKGRKVGIIMDTRLNANLAKIAKDVDFLICESTYIDEDAELARDHYHMTVKQTATVAKKAKAKKLALMHTSQKYALREKELLAEAKKIFKNTILPSDLDRIEI